MSDESTPYWEGARAGKLMLQRCRGCGKLRHYPRPVCDACYSLGADWIEASGRGRVHTWTVAHHAFDPALAGELPYTLVVVDLEEGPRVMGRWMGGALAVGEPVRVAFEDGADGRPRPVIGLAQ